jgi:hypothetical protein
VRKTVMNLVTISNDDRRVMEIENAFERDEHLNAFLRCPQEEE